MSEPKNSEEFVDKGLERLLEAWKLLDTSGLYPPLDVDKDQLARLDQIADDVYTLYKELRDKSEQWNIASTFGPEDEEADVIVVREATFADRIGPSWVSPAPLTAKIIAFLDDIAEDLNA